MPGGRPPKSAALKRLQGNPGRRPLGVEANPAPGEALRCPAWIDRRAKLKWRQLAPKLLGLRLLTELDGETLAVACQCWAEFRIATEALARHRRAAGEALEGASDPKDLVAQQRSAWNGWKAYSALFGLDPSARVRVKPPGSQGEEEDELEALKRRAREAGQD